MNNNENKKSIEECVEEIENSLADVIEKAQKINQDRDKVFCPLTRMMCRTDCECYVKATVHGIQTAAPYYLGGHCSAHSLKGQIID